MLGTSSNVLDKQIATIVKSTTPKRILELGCGSGKFGKITKEIQPEARISTIQRIFENADVEKLTAIGYEKIIDADILDYFKIGFDEHYDLIVALDVIEHFMHSDAISILKFALYRCDYMLLVWPSKHPQAAETSSYDRHRTSFEISEIAQNFDITYYLQTGFAQMHYAHRYHICLLRGHMNHKNFQPPAQQFQ